MHRNRSLSLLGAGLLALALAAPAFADQNTFTYKAHIVQPTLDDPSALDTFDVTVGDALASTTLKLECTSARGGYLGTSYGASDQTCTLNPGSASKVGGKTSAKYSGVVVYSTKTGVGQMSDLSVMYLKRSGAPQNENGNWGGSITLMPKVPTEGAMKLFNTAVAKAEAETGVKVTKSATGADFDSVTFNSVQVPVVGLADEKACSLDGNMAYPYSTEVWEADLVVTCADTSYELAGTISWDDVDDDNATYTFALTAPDSDDGVSGTIEMALANKINVKLRSGKEDDVAKNIEATGTLVGTNVPREVTDVVGKVLGGVVARAFFGA